MILLESRNLKALTGVRHAFLTRQGGVSEGPFATLSAGLRSGDDPDRVAENRARVAQALGFSPDRLVTARQVHGAECVIVGDHPWLPEAAPDADALATDRPGLLLGVLTADCAPVLLADPAAGVVGAAHAGWKGALSGVLERTVDAMLRFGATRPGITAAIGPAIAQPSYEVGPEFEARFMAEDPAGAAAYFAPVPGSDRCLFDLKGYAAGRLRGAGVQRVETLPHDTCAEEELFFSFRRATRRAEERFGVQLSVIGLPPTQR